MKAKTINAIIGGKIKDWLKSIDDEAVRKFVEKNTIVTGGCIASMLLGEDVNDFDLYFRNKETALAVANYYVNKFNGSSSVTLKDNDKKQPIFATEDKDGRIKIMVKSAGVASEGDDTEYQYFEGVEPESNAAYDYIEGVVADAEKAKQEDEKPKYRPVFLSGNAITLSNKIQLVFRFYGNPNEIHDNYDYVHCTNYWVSWHPEENEIPEEARRVAGGLVFRQKALESLLSKELKYAGSKYPLCSLIRLRKFLSRGWTINAGQMLKIIMQLNELDLNNIEVLKEQLIGVDVAYFAQMLRMLEEKKLETIEHAYLVEIIDRMF